MSTDEQRLHQALTDWLEACEQKEPLAQASQQLLQLAKEALAKGQSIASATWHQVLDITRRGPFLQALRDREQRYEWAELCFSAIEASQYTLETMLEQRVDRHPKRLLFQERDEPETHGWTYEQVRRRVRLIAAALWNAQPQKRPVVAIFADNSVESACCDLSCLLYDVFVSPLNVHLDSEALGRIFDRLQVDLVITDTEARYGLLSELRKRAQKDFRIFTIAEMRSGLDLSSQDMPLAKAYSQLGPQEVEAILAQRMRFSLREPCTAMFTSGSTGVPKGLVFSQYNLVTKRFARAAALPAVSEGEVLLCYLPLFHTFGRYLELLGSLFWGGTYVFAGNPSSDTLIYLLQRVRPTGLISIPLRWVQIRDYCQQRMNDLSQPQEQQSLFESLTGGRLRWGLSAAGHLDPKVFHFFHRWGVELCSGFGMTEATGGITMTPPGEYIDDSVGIPLPGIRTRFSPVGELQISGPYVASYLDDPDPMPEEQRWLSTGDLFETHAHGQLRIIDRVKDIYKNTKGQTIAPRRVEQKYVDVPGIKRVFLVGDGRDYNVLLIAPDRDDPLFQKAESEEMVQDYFRQIITAANKDLAAYERVINFALLDRDFSLERDELTPKGTFRRKVVEQHFASIISDLYRSSYVQLEVGGLKVRIPRWFFRDLGILETDIIVNSQGLLNVPLGYILPLAALQDGAKVRIGDLEYELRGPVLDLGLLARQPLLWVGNPSLAQFCPCKDGWDLGLGVLSPHVFLPYREASETPRGLDFSGLRSVASARLLELHQIASRALWGSIAEARQAVEQLGELLGQAEDRAAELIRRRLEALARHPDFEVRSRAYRIVLLDRQVPDANLVLPSFVEAGLPFLDEQSIEIIARSKLERRRLEAFRQRLARYRQVFSWPVHGATHDVFVNVFRLLSNFAQYNPEYYGAVREELVAWIMHSKDPELGQIAEQQLESLAAHFECRLESSGVSSLEWEGKIVFQDGISEEEMSRLRSILTNTCFLKQSVLLAFDGEIFDIKAVGLEGIWVSRTWSLHHHRSYRVSINTNAGKHYDLQVILPDEIELTRLRQSIYWLILIYGYPYGTPVVPRFGCWRPELGAVSLAYSNDLTVWERVREYASVKIPGAEWPSADAWRKLFVRGMAAFFSGWKASGARIVPGAVNPSNVVVPEPDFREGTTILSLTDWRPYENPLSLIRPLLRNFYLQTVSHFPWCRRILQYRWVFDACIEALGPKEAKPFLQALHEELCSQPLEGAPKDWDSSLQQVLESLEKDYYMPLSLQFAIRRYEKWRKLNPEAMASAKEEIVVELQRLYGLERFGEQARYHLYRHTYFADKDPTVLSAFDRLLTQLMRQAESRAAGMVELSDLQATLGTGADRMIFSHMVFPHAQPEQQLELVAVGEPQHKTVIVRSYILDNQDVSYTVREPIDASEVGKLYRLYVTAGFFKTISREENFLVVLDAQEQVIGGLCYRFQSPGLVHLDGIVVTSSLRGRGINAAILEDFCARMANQNQCVVKTHFFVRHFYMQHGFFVDKRWGGLVRFLEPEEKPRRPMQSTPPLGPAGRAILLNE